MGYRRAGTRAATLAVLMTTILAVAPAAQAATKEFNKDSGDWATDGNWTPTGVPGAEDVALVPDGRTATVSASASVGALTLDGSLSVGDATLTVGTTAPSELDGTITLDSGVLALGGTTSWVSGSLIRHGTGQLQAGGTLILEHSFTTVAGTGTGAGLRVLPTGTLTASAGAFVSSVENDGVVSASAEGTTLAVRLAGAPEASAGSFEGSPGSLRLTAAPEGTHLAGSLSGSVGLSGSWLVPATATFSPTALAIEEGRTQLSEPERVGSLQLFSGAVIGGFGELTVTGPASFAGGRVELPLVVEGQATFTGGAELVIDAGLVTNSFVSWRGGDITLGDGAGWTMRGDARRGIAPFGGDSPGTLRGPSSARVTIEQGSLVHESAAAGLLAPLTVAAGAVLVNQSGTLGLGATTIAGSVQLDPAATLDGDLALAAGGLLVGAGTVTGALTGDGTVRPFGTLTVGSFRPGPDATLQLRLEPEEAASSRVAATTATLAGRLALTTANGWQPAPGVTRTAVGGTVSGAFTTVDGTALPNGRRWALGGGVLTVQPRPAPALLAPPGIDGTARQGELLTCTEGSWTNEPTERGYRWQRDGAAIPGAATQTYELTAEDAEHRITCVERATNEGGSAEAQSTGAIVPVALPPRLVTAPAIVGATTRGELLTCQPGTWANGTTSRSYAWTREGVAIPGATEPTYRSTDADVGAGLRCVETAANSGGAGQPAASAPVTISAPATIGTPVTTTTGDGQGGTGAATTLARLVARNVIKLSACRKGKLKLTVKVPAGAKLASLAVAVGKGRARRTTKAQLTVKLPRKGAKVTATVKLADGRTVKLAKRVARCR